ncbi:MAG: archease [Dehalococcoidales bacterium]|nr:archease [Dehalococcoidales bacterium]
MVYFKKAMEKEFEIIDHTADVGIIAYGADIKQAFANAAKAMFSLITELDDIDEVLHRDVEVVSSDRENLLVAWLNELIYLFDVENILFKRFDIARLNQTQLKARVYGEKVDNVRHKVKLGIKAATYHMLKIEKENGVKAQVVFDI